MSLSVLVAITVYGQNFERKKFDYSTLKVDTVICSEKTKKGLNVVLVQIEQLQSEQAAKTAKKLYENSDKCSPGHRDVNELCLLCRQNQVHPDIYHTCMKPLI